MALIWALTAFATVITLATALVVGAFLSRGGTCVVTDRPGERDTVTCELDGRSISDTDNDPAHERSDR